MNKHACIFICYNNTDHIIESFNSIYKEDIDFFIIENKSINSDLISNFFITHKNKIFKYIQFQENIANNALDIFLKDFYRELCDYNYITFTDGDLRIDNTDNTFKEIIKNLYLPDVLVSCVNLYTHNLPNIPGSQSWLPAGTKTEEYIECFTGIHLMTIIKENLFLFKNLKFLDSNFHSKTISLNKKWVKTIHNKAYHLTWDLYKNNNSYYKFKLDNLDIWTKIKSSAYITII